MALQGQNQHLQDDNRRVRRRRGFSLVETMMGSMVMVMVLAGAFSGLSQGIRMADQARNEQFADQLLQSEANFLKTLRWAQINNLQNISPLTSTETQAYFSTGLSSHAPRNFFTGQIPLMGVSFERIVTTPTSNRKDIELRLTWTEVSGREVSRSHHLAYTKDGMHDSYTPVL